MSRPDRTTLEETPTEDDLAVIAHQLGRPARGVVSIAHRCPCGCPTVVRTEPRLPDGTPFPTTFYVTCPRLTGAISTLESQGLMKEMTQRLSEDEDLRWDYAQAHNDYLRRREELAHVPELAGVSAGGSVGRSPGTSVGEPVGRSVGGVMCALSGRGRVVRRRRGSAPPR